MKICWPRHGIKKELYRLVAAYLVEIGHTIDTQSATPIVCVVLHYASEVIYLHIL